MAMYTGGYFFHRTQCIEWVALDHANLCSWSYQRRY